MSDKNEDKNLKDYVLALLWHQVEKFEVPGSVTDMAKANALGCFANNLKSSCPVKYESGSLCVTYKNQDFIVSRSDRKIVNGHLFTVTSTSIGGRSVEFVSSKPRILEEVAEKVLHGYAIVDYIIIQAIKSLV